MFLDLTALLRRAGRGATVVCMLCGFRVSGRRVAERMAGHWERAHGFPVPRLVKETVSGRGTEEWSR